MTQWVMVWSNSQVMFLCLNYLLGVYSLSLFYCALNALTEHKCPFPKANEESCSSFVNQLLFFLIHSSQERFVFKACQLLLPGTLVVLCLSIIRDVVETPKVHHRFLSFCFYLNKCQINLNLLNLNNYM